MIKLTSAGESHGKALTGIVEGLPYGMPVDEDEINRYLALRQKGYGRGARQSIERDCVEILSGVRGGITLASPVAFTVQNRDYEAWQSAMDSRCGNLSERQITAPRPGHADFAGMQKYFLTDARNVAERASARETAVRVVAGALARQYLSPLGVRVSGYVKSVCGIEDEAFHPFEELEAAKSQPLFMLDSEVQNAAMAYIDTLAESGDSAGGIVEIRVNGLKGGFGGCMTYAEKLDAALCGAIMGVQAVKGVEVGLGFASADLSGSRVHDEIFCDGERYFRKTNNAGGIEGGMSNGEEIVLRAAMKPIPTLGRGLSTVDMVSRKKSVAASERSDVCAICALEVILESVVCLTVANAVSVRLGGDTYGQVKERYADL